MNRFHGALALAIFAASALGALPADDPNHNDDKDKNKDTQVQAVLDKAIKALGGAENLKKAANATWKTRAMVIINGEENAIEIHSTVQGLDHYRAEIKGNFGGNEFEGAVVLNGDHGWRRFGEKMEMDDEALAHERRRVYLQAVPTCILPLKSGEFRAKPSGEEDVDGKPATVIEVTAPDGKDFRLFFDKESGMPVKLTARVVGFQGEEYNQETTFKDYKDFGGIKKATKIDSARDGEEFIRSEITEFQALDKVDAQAFAEPED